MAGVTFPFSIGLILILLNLLTALGECWHTWPERTNHEFMSGVKRHLGSGHLGMGLPRYVRSCDRDGFMKIA